MIPIFIPNHKQKEIIMKIGWMISSFYSNIAEQFLLLANFKYSLEILWSSWKKVGNINDFGIDFEHLNIDMNFAIDFQNLDLSMNFVVDFQH
jgi:hypothetical protein